jgi:hypothetical protein
LTNVILIFFVIVFSIQSKISFKINILADRFMSLWNGSENMENKKDAKRSAAPATFTGIPQVIDSRSSNSSSSSSSSGPSGTSGSAAAADSSFLPANSVLGGSFANLFS